MNKRKADGLGFLLRCVLGGIVLGSIIGIFIGLNGFDADIFLAVAITLIAVILMGLCLYPLIANLKNDLIRKKGIRVEAEIAEVVDIIASPLYYQQGNNGN